MKFQTGDKVFILHSNEEGEVVDIINDKMVMVEVKGVKFPAYIDQLEFPYYRRFMKSKPEPPKTKKYIDSVRTEKSVPRVQVTEGVWLAFFPVFDKDIFDEDVVEKFKLYLVNQTRDELNFTYWLDLREENVFELSNSVPALGDFYVHDVAFEQLNDAPRFVFEFSLARPDKTKAEYYETSLKLKGKQVFQRIEEMRAKQEASFSYRLFENYPARIAEEKLDLGKLTAGGYKVVDARNFKANLPPARTVIDLHIEKLTDDWKEMSNIEKLDLQLKTFEKYYELALLHHQPILIVVHGVGTGRLRDEIHDILRLKREVKSFVNQYHPSFGYGATEIFFQY